MKKLIIFDCDGTLIDSEMIAAKVFPSVWSEMGLSMTEEEFICNFVGSSNDSEIVKKTLAKLPINAMEIADLKFDEELQKSLQAVPGIAQMLKMIPHEVCVASNSSLKYLKEVLALTKLEVFFKNKIYSARQLNKPKPAPDVFLFAAKGLGFTPKECLVIEDSVPGILAAKSAGMSVVGFMGGGHFRPTVTQKLLAADADYYCSSTDELLKIITAHWP